MSVERDGASRARAVIAPVLRVGLGALLLVAGLLKLRDPAGFATEVANYQLLPSLSAYVAATLPGIEVALAVGLTVLPPAWRRAAAAGALALLTAFAGAVGSAYFRHINIACGCFGGGGDTIGPLTLARNLALVAAAAALLRLDRGGDRAPSA
jgi:uncharacterized membrane protein YphA (DoxX/SURF4 family)